MERKGDDCFDNARAVSIEWQGNSSEYHAPKSESNKELETAITGELLNEHRIEMWRELETSSQIQWRMREGESNIRPH